jgi:hypothetical protein
VTRRSAWRRALALGVGLTLAIAAPQAWNAPERMVSLAFLTLFYTAPTVTALLYIWGYLPVWLAPPFLSLLRRSHR